MREKILLYILQNGDATFVGLVNSIGDAAKGELEWEMGPNVILWTGMSEAFTTAMLALKSEKLITPDGTSRFVYMIDGGTLRLPIAKRPTDRGYKKPHWLPLIFHLTENGKKAAKAIPSATIPA